MIENVICSGIFRRLFLLLLALLCASSVTEAADIIWATPHNITGETDVSTNGSLIGAYSIGPLGVSNPTINGVPFNRFIVPDGSTNAVTGNFALSALANTLNSGNGEFGSLLPPFHSLSVPYQLFLFSAVFGAPSFALTISGLIVGAQYEFQWWANYSTSVIADAYNSHTATAGNSVTLTANTLRQQGGLGQFAIGRFTADSSTQTIIFSGPVYGLMNGFQLRQVPENGSTFVFLAVSLALVLGCATITRRGSQGY